MPAIVIMGPSGCGKTTLGRALAEDLGWSFVEGDELHPQSNIDKMSAGIPLTDKDRQPFLENVAAAIVQHEQDGVVAACSALKKRYRNLIRDAQPDAIFVLPPVDRAQLLLNLKDREDHFMPPDLIDSQLHDLEMPGATERSIDLAGVGSVEDAITLIRKSLISGLRCELQGPSN